MFKLEKATDCYLFVSPRFSGWRFTSDLRAKRSFLSSTSAGQGCPAHPRIKFWGADISIQCTTHNDKWLLQQAMESSWDKKDLQSLVDYILPRLSESKLEEEMVRAAREGKWEKEKVAELLCQMSTEGTIVYSMLDFNIQKEVALWNLGATNKIAHMMPHEFIQWLISQANEGNWSKEEVGSIVCRKNKDNQLILATLDEETQKQVAVFNKANTISAVPYMDSDFLQWLYQEAEEGRWNQQIVFKALTKEEVDGKVKVTTRIKSGSKIVL